MVLRHGVGGLSGIWPLPVKPCDSCKVVPSLIFCRADSAFLCMACDGKVHGVNPLASRHERVWMCEVCEQEPASVTCKADAAALCVACDADIHSANTLARRHDRVPVVPFFEPAASVLAKSNAASLLHKNYDDDDKLANHGNNNSDIVVVPAPVEEEEDGMVGRDIEEAWLLPSVTTTKVVEQPDQFKSGDFFFTEVDPFLDLDYGSPMAPRFGANINSSAMDSVVPLQTTPPPAPPFPSFFPPSSGRAFVDAAGDYYRPKPCYSYNTTTPSLSHSVLKHITRYMIINSPLDQTNKNKNCINVNIYKSVYNELQVSSSSLDVGVVPDGSYTGGGGGSKAVAATVDAAGGGTGGREARVLRYREKRKNRKFEKTIRYASRKAYAETRPRIKGRFAKRAVVKGDADGIYSAAAAMIADTAGYSVVPSF